MSTLAFIVAEVALTALGAKTLSAGPAAVVKENAVVKLYVVPV